MQRNENKNNKKNRLWTVEVLVTCHLMCVHTVYGSVWVTEWPLFLKYLLTWLTICSVCILTISYFSYFTSLF